MESKLPSEVTKKTKVELYNDNFENFKRYQIPKAQLMIADIPYNIGNNAYASNPAWYKDGDNKKGESEKAKQNFFNRDERFNLISEGAELFGSQCIVLAIDAKFEDNHWVVYTAGGRKNEGIDAVEWAARGAELGAGEILLTSMDADGTKKGFDLGLTAAVSSSVGVPVIASGGAGEPEHFKQAFDAGADAALAASLFHFRQLEIEDLKKYLAAEGVPVRL